MPFQRDIINEERIDATGCVANLEVSIAGAGGDVLGCLAAAIRQAPTQSRLRLLQPGLDRFEPVPRL